MKLAPVLHAGGLKKALALAGLGAASAGAAYKGSHDPTADPTVAVDGISISGAMHRDAAGQDAGPQVNLGITEEVQIATAKVAAVARSVKAAWDRRNHHRPHPPDNGTPPSGPFPSQPTTNRGVSGWTTAALASVLAEAAKDNMSDPVIGTALRISLARSWAAQRVLIAAATDPDPSTTMFQDACAFLSGILVYPDAAVELLARPGAAAALLDVAAASPRVQAATLTALSLIGASGPSGLASRFALGPPSAEDLAAAAAAAAALTQTEPRRLLSLRLLRVWAEASPAACKRLADLGLGPRLGAVAGSCVSSGEGLARSETARLMAALAQKTPFTIIRSLGMEGWLFPLVCFAADAAGEGEWALARGSLSALTSCVTAGAAVPPQLLFGAVQPLLARLVERAAVPQGERAATRATVAAAVGALAAGPAAAELPADDRTAWAETLLAWVTEGTIDAAEERDKGREECGAACVEALCNLAAPPGIAGLQVAHLWLAEIINFLSLEVERSQAAAAAAEARRAAAAAAAAAAQAAWYTSFWRPSYWKSGSGGVDSSTDMSSGKPGAAERPPQGAAAPAGSRAGAASAFAAQAAAAQQRAQEVEEESEEPAAAEAAVAAEAEAFLGPAVAADAAANNSNASKWTRWVPAWPSYGSYSSSSTSSPSQTPPLGTSAESGELPLPPLPSPPPSEGPDRVRSDSELSLFINAAPVGPSYARSVAMELLAASGRVGTFTEPPADAGEALSPDAVAAYSAVAAAVDVEVADRALTQALKVLSAMAAGEEGRRGWLVRSAGLLKLLRRLAMERGAHEIEAIYAAAAEAAAGPASPETAAAAATAAAAIAQWEAAAGVEGASEGPPLLPLRQALRLVALVAVDVPGAAAVAAEPGWLPWLRRLQGSDDCKVASCAAKALLNVESAAAVASGATHGAAQGGDPTPTYGNLSSSSSSSSSSEDGSSISVPLSLDSALAAVQRLRRELAAASAEVLSLPLPPGASPPVPPDRRLVLHDGIHLFDPSAAHHEALARRGVAATGADAPLLDVVFVHGIRGGAFATWRREGVLERGAAAGSLNRAGCWPAAWLAPALGPRVRLLSAEYAAPASAWEGESLPFHHTAEQVSAKLVAAGVGAAGRPVVFVTHSMGGLVIKEILARGLEISKSTTTAVAAPVPAQQPAPVALAPGTASQRRLAAATSGLVFYSVPHAGSRLADWGWTLRYVGASPAKAVAQLTTGPYVDKLNSAVRGLARKGLPVLSFSEGLPTALSGRYMKTLVVPHESAYPGYGDFVVLQAHDHISVVKPRDTEDPSFAVLFKFLKERVAAAEAAEAAEAAKTQE